MSEDDGDDEAHTGPSDEPAEPEPDDTPTDPADRPETAGRQSETFGLDANVGDGPDGADDTDAAEAGTPQSNSVASDAGGADADAPLSSLASSVDQRRDRQRDRPDDELFDEESVPEIDADVVWERIDEDEPPELPEDADREVTVIDKSSYCEQCPFFSSPPEVQCGHDGTEILELTDMDHFRVVDCPKVRENERLERL